MLKTSTKELFVSPGNSVDIWNLLCSAARRLINWNSRQISESTNYKIPSFTTINDLIQCSKTSITTLSVTEIPSVQPFSLYINKNLLRNAKLKWFKTTLSDSKFNLTCRENFCSEVSDLFFAKRTLSGKCDVYSQNISRNCAHETLLVQVTAQ